MNSLYLNILFSWNEYQLVKLNICRKDDIYWYASMTRVSLAKHFFLNSNIVHGKTMNNNQDDARIIGCHVCNIVHIAQ